MSFCKAYILVYFVNMCVERKICRSNINEDIVISMNMEKTMCFHFTNSNLQQPT